MEMGWGPGKICRGEVGCELLKKNEWHSIDYPYSKLLATLLEASIKG